MTTTVYSLKPNILLSIVRKNYRNPWAYFCVSELGYCMYLYSGRAHAPAFISSKITVGGYKHNGMVCLLSSRRDN